MATTTHTCPSIEDFRAVVAAMKANPKRVRADIKFPREKAFRCRYKNHSEKEEWVEVINALDSQDERIIYRKQMEKFELVQ